jgi:hypothetical protein
VADITAGRAGERVGSHRRYGRRYTTYSQVIGGGFVANVVDGRLVGFGTEPCTDLVIELDGRIIHRDRRRPVLVWAAPIAGAAAAAAGAMAAAAAGAMATSAILRHRRVA